MCDQNHCTVLQQTTYTPAEKANRNIQSMFAGSLIPRPSPLVGKIRKRKAWENLSLRDCGQHLPF
jgi:hypothetical protein